MPRSPIYPPSGGAPTATDKTIVLDMDSSESPTYGAQEGSA